MIFHSSPGPPPENGLGGVPTGTDVFASSSRSILICSMRLSSAAITSALVMSVPLEMFHQYIDDNDDEGADNGNCPRRLPDGALQVPYAVFGHDESRVNRLGHSPPRILLALGI